MSLSSRESDAVLDSPLSKSSDFEDVCNAETVQECLADIRKRAQAWELPYGAVGDWPMMMKISEMQYKDGEPHWIRGGEQLVEWLDTLREHASKGDVLLEELSGLVGLPMPREGWMVQDIFRQVIDLTRIITQGVQQVRARLEVAHLHYMPPYSFKTRVYDKSGERRLKILHFETDPYLHPQKIVRLLCFTLMSPFMTSTNKYMQHRLLQLLNHLSTLETRETLRSEAWSCSFVDL